MAEVTIHDGPETAKPAAKPSEDLVRAALKQEEITDERGRKIVMRKPGVLAQFRLIQAVGPETAANDTYMRMINPLLYVGSIDGEEVFPPASLREVELLIQRLDDEGLGAAMAWYMANVIGPTMEAMAAAEKAAQLKN